MPDYDATLKQHLQAVVDGSRAAQTAMRKATKYWYEVYSVEVPNAPNQLVPSSLMEGLNEAAAMLAGLSKRISEKL